MRIFSGGGAAARDGFGPARGVLLFGPGMTQLLDSIYKGPSLASPRPGHETRRQDLSWRGLRSGLFLVAENQRVNRSRDVECGWIPEDQQILAAILLQHLEKFAEVLRFHNHVPQEEVANFLIQSIAQEEMKAS